MVYVFGEILIWLLAALILGAGLAVLWMRLIAGARGDEQLAPLRERIAALELERDSLRRDVGEARDRATERETQLSALRDDLGARDTKVVGLVAEVERLRTTGHGALPGPAEADAAAGQLRAELAAARQRLALRETEVSELNAELANAREAYHHLEAAQFGVADEVAPAAAAVGEVEPVEATVEDSGPVDATMAEGDPLQAVPETMPVPVPAGDPAPAEPVNETAMADSTGEQDAAAAEPAAEPEADVGEEIARAAGSDQAPPWDPDEAPAAPDAGEGPVPAAEAAAGEPVPAGTSAPAPADAAASADDLTRIEGIGKVLEGRLNALGIRTYAQIAAFSPDDVMRIGGQLSPKGRIERDRWITQARDLLAARER